MGLTDSGRFARLLFNAPILPYERVLHALGIAKSKSDVADVPDTQAQLPRHAAKNAVVKICSSKFGADSDKLLRQIHPSGTAGRILGANITVKRKVSSLRVENPVISDLAARLRETRLAKGLTQKQLAASIGVTASAVTQWEKGLAKPQPMAMVAIGNFFGGDEGKWWMENAGRTKEMIEATIERYMMIAAASDAVQVPLISGRVAAGTPRVVDEKHIEEKLCLPANWVRPSQRVIAVRVAGDSMSPIIEEGYIALIDIAQRDPRRLIGTMVAAREGDGVTIKWLRKEGEYFQLVPQNTSLRHPVRVLTAESDFGIVGRVIRWIGEPPKR
jgi:SOS-response transcriptional repressor LexA